MISNEERRKVARKLREPKESLLAHPDEELIRLRYETGCQRGQDIYEHFADLIDRPTCHDEGSDCTFQCSKCGCELDIVDVEGELTMWFGGFPKIPKYCPYCGAEVIDEDSAN